MEEQTATNELLDRIIGNYVCSIYRTEGGILEKTYERNRGDLEYVSKNIIPTNHPRYKELNQRLLLGRR